METKYFEMTGSPKPQFSKKEEFVIAMSAFNWIQSKMTKKNNKCNVLVCSDLSSDSNKMQLAKELGVEIMTYEEIVELFELS